MGKLEAKFQADLIKDLEERFKGCIVLKNDANYLQGVPDLTMFWGSNWYTFECKKSAKESKQPNQEWYVNRMNSMGGHSYFIYPENKEAILNEIQKTSGVFGDSRFI